MNVERRTTLVLAASSVAFLSLAGLFAAKERAPQGTTTPELRRGASLKIEAAPVRISAERLIKDGGDTSVLDCYACHDEKKPAKTPLDAAGRVVLPEAHADLIFSMRNCASCHEATRPVKLEINKEGNTIIPPAHARDLVIAHGQNSRNSGCFNCHDPAKLNELVTRDGTRLPLEKASLLCASCHGPTYRDWEAGVHGKTTGFWKRDAGAATRLGCTECHDPHSPAFPAMIPLPGPKSPHPHSP